MVLDTQRENIDPLLSKIARCFTWVHPDVFTWVALGFALLAGLFFYLSSPDEELMNYYLFIASLFVFLNGLFDAIDGKIAKITDQSSNRGDFLDHALDRYADVFIVGGLALSAWCDLRIGFFAVIGMLLTSYMGTQAQAVGYKRVYAGMLGRADRLVLLMITPLVQHILLRYHLDVLWGFTLLEWVLIYLAVMGNITAVQRFYQTLKAL